MIKGIEEMSLMNNYVINKNKKMDYFCLIL